MAQVSLAWVLSKPLVASPVVGFTKISQLESLCKVFKIKLSEEDIKYLEELYVPHKVVPMYKITPIIECTFPNLYAIFPHNDLYISFPHTYINYFPKFLNFNIIKAKILKYNI